MAGFDFAGLAGPALGLVGGMFGGKAKRNPYADQIASNARNLAMNRQGYQGITSAAQNSFQQFDPQYKRSVSDYADYLRTDPYTDSYSTRQLSRATVGTNSSYDTAKSRLAAEMARRGISGSGSEIGTLGSIEAERAGQISNAQNDLAFRAADARQSRLAALTDLYGNARNNERTALFNGLSGATGIDSDLLHTYAGMNSEANSYAAQEDTGMSAALGAAAQGFGTAFARKPISLEDLQTLIEQQQLTAPSGLDMVLPQQHDRYGNYIWPTPTARKY